MLVPVERIEKAILVLRGQKIMLDSDLAELYGVATKVLNQAVKRNRDRFPEDFMFQLTAEEKDEVVTNCDHLKRLKFSPVLPFAFTEHGAIMARRGPLPGDYALWVSSPPQRPATSLAQAEEGTAIGEVCRSAGISEATFYNWRKKYGGQAFRSR